MHFRDNAYYYVLCRNKTQKWIHIGYDMDAAYSRYMQIEHGVSADGKGAPKWISIDTYLPTAFWSARKNARNRGIEFELTRDEFDAICRRADGKCEVTQIPFNLIVRPNSLRRPWAPSLDRIDASKHYEATNCRLVCGIVNAAMSDWGEATFWSLVKKAKRLKRTPALEAPATIRGNSPSCDATS